MAIADTINSIREHLTADYESLENIGAELENVDKNIENIASVVNGIYDNLPKTTGEDTNLSLTTLKGKMNLGLKGDISQYSTQGYQLLNSTLATSTQGTIAVTNNGDGSYTLNGTASSTVAVKIGDGITLENGSDYTLFVFNESTIGNTSTSGTWCDLRLSNSSGNIINGCSVAWGTANAKVTKNITSDYTNAKVEFRVGGGITLNNFKIKPMLIKGNDTAKTFEKYTGGTASPNPTYPQNIEVVTGTQEVKVSGNEFAEIETQTLNDMKITKTDNGYILNGTASANTTFRATITNTTNSNKTLCVKCDTAITNANIQVKTRSSNATQLRSISLENANTWVVSSGTFEDYYCDIYVKSGTTLSNVLVQPMLLEGTFTTSNLGKYQPYNEEQTQIVSLGDIELCKIGNYQDYLYKTSGKNLWGGVSYTKTQNGLTLKTNEDGSIQVTGTTTGGASASLSVAEAVQYNKYITLQAGTYNIKGGGSNYQIQVIDTSSNIIKSLGVGTTSGTFTLSETKQVFCRVYLEATSGNSFNINAKIMLSKEDIPYEPYGSDKWYKKEYIGKIANKTNWVVGNIASNNRCPMGLVANGYADASGEGYANINGYSNYFSGISQVNQATTTNINNIAVNNSNIYIKFADTINTRELAKAQLDSMTDLVIYYGLAIPNDIEITNSTLIEQLDNLEKLKSYNGTTNISSSGSLPMILNISALKGE